MASTGNPSCSQDVKGIWGRYRGIFQEKRNLKITGHEGIYCKAESMRKTSLTTFRPMMDLEALSRSGRACGCGSKLRVVSAVCPSSHRAQRNRGNVCIFFLSPGAIHRNFHPSG
jgi:hypothetical protein